MEGFDIKFWVKQICIAAFVGCFVTIVCYLLGYNVNIPANIIITASGFAVGSVLVSWYDNFKAKR